MDMTAYERGESWFLAQARPNCIHIAERNLQRQGFGLFLPREERSRRSNGKFVSVLAPLFPGYIFVSINAAPMQWRAINSTYGVTRLVSFGGVPAPVPIGVVSELMLRCDVSGKLLPPKRLAPGEWVRVTAGPFADFVGQIEKIAPDRRVWVLLELMGGQTRVAIRSGQLRAVIA